MTLSLRQNVLLLIAGIALMQVLGIGSGVDRIGLLFISVALLSALISSLGSGMQAVERRQDSSESTHRFNNDNYRVFIDASDGIWLRVSDLRHTASLILSDRELALRYPGGFGEVSPQLEARYIHLDALRHLARQSKQAALLMVSQWANGDLLVRHRFARRMSASGDKLTTSDPDRRHWLRRYWYGEIGLFRSVFLGGGVVAALSYLAGQIEGPVDITEHYQLVSAIELGRLLVVSGMFYVWARGVLYSAMRWVAADRSLWVALFACCVGLFALSTTLSQVMKTERQYLVTEFLTIVSDSDTKPAVRYVPEGRHIEMIGPMGFGTKQRVRKALNDHPEVRTLLLKSYGGRLAEGVALRELIVSRQLDTYVRKECMSACVAAFMGGRQRVLADTANIGLHRAGHHWQDGDSGPSLSDRLEADYMRRIGVTEDFIERAQRPSIHDIYEPSPKEALDAGLATGLVSER